jgi:LPXTG-motif cell wall-anchored protein
MSKKFRLLSAVLAVLLLTPLIALPASAGGGSDVWVNGVWLSSASPYWKNGNAPASASDWNAYFDDATNTLTLNNAEITDPYPPLGASMILAYDDLNLVLNGTNTLIYTETENPALYGVNALGALTVSGSGSLEIRLIDTNELSSVIGLAAEGTIAINSGTLSFTVSGTNSYCILSLLGVTIAGGTMEMHASAVSQALLVLSEGAAFRMTGGKFWGSATSDEDAAGIVSNGVMLAGGEGEFYAQSTSFGVGLFDFSPELYVSGGHFIFAGDTNAAIGIFTTGGDMDLQLTNVQTYVSESVDSFAKRLWTSNADGRLVGIIGNPSPFLYAEFRSVSKAVPVPQTGDVSRPWLWAGVALCALLTAGLFTVWRKRRSA